MIRTPLRPLARILDARAKGQNPDTIERENIAARHEEMKDRARTQAERRLRVLALSFFVLFSVIGLRMGTLAATEPSELRSASSGAEITAQRADILDRNGRILATNMMTHSLYVQTADLVDPARTATELGKIFPELDAEALLRRFTDGRSFLWVRKVLSPEQMQKVHEIGDPGLYFGPREMRLYPNGTLAAHILGGSAFGNEGVDSAEVIGTAGIEKAMDTRLRDPAQSNTPLKLSIDLTLQANVEEVLSTGMKTLNAKGAAAILMDVKTGEVLAMASLPDFDPNDRPAPALTGDPSDSPLFNRSVQGVYELGSTFKVFAVAQAMDLGLINADTPIDTKQPFVYDGFRINEFDNHNYGATLPTWEVIAVSSNIGSAHIGLMIGGERQQAFLRTLGLLDAPMVELAEAPSARALVPKNWSGIVTVTASYGHGISTSLMNLAAAYATIGNGGLKVTPTLIHDPAHKAGARVISEATALSVVQMMRRVVTDGTATFADVPGYGVAGKTGTAEKPKRNGKGYDSDKVINTFASVFPANDPKYVLVVTLDEPVETAGSKPRRTAGYTAVPVAGEIIRRIAPLVGLRPDGESPMASLVAYKDPLAQE
ncbi:penicillin-binding protein 2 [Rhodobacter sp. KR11]|jgi:cell division protein FtsI (penicillin-binding protein 3)|uniref:peptidoglycan D,D-transpeptidase FtsI family protein n=1 Tax=Rhodobacter sp. KR11 TaxID=2974588 RepID=UPI002222C9D5|nr:penicillin-binding protein 2 [Rhodobacter sp. KR11]MCW1917426.1 penicillin-binding protein 2 [Rhodobacter sp. KR11]